jgi:hypothetical protein
MIRGRPADFQGLWNRQQASRKWARGVTRGNRCALVMSRTLGVHPESPAEMSWVGVSEVTPPYRGRPELKDYYLKADQLAKRLERDWGPPDLYMAGRLASRLVRDQRGVMFIENRWGTSADRLKTVGAGLLVFAAESVGLSTPDERSGIIDTIAGPSVDHIDVWDGDRTAGGDEDGHEGYSFATVAAAQYVWLWRIG